MNTKYFTPLEANKRLPLIRQIVADILARARDLKLVLAEGDREQQNRAYDQTLDEMEKLIDELHSLGCYYKDWNFEKGLVDFPSWIDGKEVLLCWRSDEPEVRWYHPLEEGFAGRRPIPENLLGESKGQDLQG